MSLSLSRSISDLPTRLLIRARRRRHRRRRTAAAPATSLRRCPRSRAYVRARARRPLNRLYRGPRSRRTFHRVRDRIARSARQQKETFGRVRQSRSPEPARWDRLRIATLRASAALAEAADPSIRRNDPGGRAKESPSAAWRDLRRFGAAVEAAGSPASIRLPAI